MKENLNRTRLICSALHLICLDLSPSPLPKPSSASPVLSFCCTLSPSRGPSLRLPQERHAVTSSMMSLTCNDTATLETPRHGSKCSALGKHRGFSFGKTRGILSDYAEYSQRLTKREQVATQWALVSLGAQRADFSWEPGTGLRNDHSKWHLQQSQIQVPNHQFFFPLKRMQSPGQSLPLHSEFN